MAASISTVVINLDADVERRAHMHRELSRAGLPFEIFPAVRGDDLPTGLETYFPSARGHPILSRGEIGCYASHLAVCRRIASGEWATPVLVLEDDVVLAEDFGEVLKGVLAALPEAWDLVRLSSETKHACLNVAELSPGRNLIRYSNVPVSAGAILWNRSGAQKFVQRRTRTLPVDQDLRLVWTWDLDTYGVLRPPALRDRCGPSRIDAMAPTGWRGAPARTKLVRRVRRRAALRRHVHGVKVFGVLDWMRAEAVNLLARGGRVIEPLART